MTALKRDPLGIPARAGAGVTPDSGMATASPAAVPATDSGRACATSLGSARPAGFHTVHAPPEAAMTTTGRTVVAISDRAQAGYLDYLRTRLRAEVRNAERAVERYSARDLAIGRKYPDRITHRLRKQEDTGIADEAAALAFHAQMCAVYSAALCGEAAAAQLLGG